MKDEPMSEFIALLFVSFNEEPIVPYQINTCYKTNTYYRPNIIKVLKVDLKTYSYKIWYGNLWSNEKKGKMKTINMVYDEKVLCP